MRPENIKRSPDFEGQGRTLSRTILRTAKRDRSRCTGCDYCLTAINCPGEDACTGCGACVAACPFEAQVLAERDELRAEAQLILDGRPIKVPERITLLQALEISGYPIGTFPGEGRIIAPCRTGGCWACAVLVDGELRPSCITPVKDGAVVETEPARLAGREPQRLVFGFSGHMVGGVGTLWGAFFGAIFIMFVPNLAEQVSKAAPWAVYGVVLIAIMFAMPGGVMGLLNKLRARA